MSWHYSRALVEASSEVSLWGGKQSVPWKSTPMHVVYCYNGKMTESLIRFLSGMMSKHSMESYGEDISTRFPLGFPARTSVQPVQTMMLMEAKWDWMEKIVGFGFMVQELLRKLCLDVLLLKIPRIYDLKGLSKSCSFLTRWGMTHKGECLDVAISARITIEKECGSSRCLPTPTRHNAKEGAYPAEYTRNTPTLAAQIGGPINPEWNEWRMGWPIGWTDLEPLEMDRFQQWLGLHGKF
jgi:hypothetical protein